MIMPEDELSLFSPSPSLPYSFLGNIHLMSYTFNEIALSFCLAVSKITNAITYYFLLFFKQFNREVLGRRRGER